LWEADRSAELAIFMEEPKEGTIDWLRRLVEGEGMGVRSLERMLARRLELLEPADSLTRRLQNLLNAITEDQVSARSMRSLLLFDVPDRVEGLPATQLLRILWETALPWLEAWQRHLPEDAGWTRDLSVSYNKLGDVYFAIGETAKALEFYQKALEIAERLYSAEPHRADFARDLAVSYDRMARVSGGLESAEGRWWFERARKLLRQQLAQGKTLDAQIQRYLNWLEEVLG